MPSAALRAWRSTGGSRGTPPAPPRMRGRTPSFPDQRSSAAPITRVPSPRCAIGSGAGPLVLVVLVVILILVARHLGGGLSGRRAWLGRHDDGTGLHLRTRVEDDDGLAGGAQQALLLEYLKHASRHLARAAHQARELLAAYLDLHALRVGHGIGLAAQIHDGVRH